MHHSFPVAVFLITLWSAAPLAAGECDPTDPQHYGSSLTAWIEATAQALEERASEWNIREVRVDILPGEGIDPIKGKRVFSRRLQARLQERGQVSMQTKGAPLRLELSLEGGTFWALGSIESSQVPGGAALAASCPQDRELASLMGSRSRHAGQGRWTLSPLGRVSADVLDILLLDVDRDGRDDIVLLAKEGLQALRYEPGDGRPVKIAGPAPLPPGSEWPGMVVGWLAEDENGKAAVATSAGHSLSWSGARLTQRPVAEGRIVPLRGVTETEEPEDEPPALSLLSGGPALSSSHLELPLPSPLRALCGIPGRPEAWVWVQETGELGLSGWDEAIGSLPAGPVGDDILVDELDGEVGPELVTTGAGGPGDPDSLTIHRLRAGRSTSVVFRQTWNGSILGIASGDLDFDGLPDLVLAEELGAGKAQLWHLERSR
jgi:hypothetical protein